MTLLVTVIALIITTTLWYLNKQRSKMLLAIPMFSLAGASIMWLVDAIIEYIEEGASYFTPSGTDILNDLFLGIAVIAFIYLVWIIVVIIRDPLQTRKKKEE